MSDFNLAAVAVAVAVAQMHRASDLVRCMCWCIQ